MIIFEAILIVMFIALIVFGRIEIHKSASVFQLKLGLVIAGRYIPLIAIDKTALPKKSHF